MSDDIPILPPALEFIEPAPKPENHHHVHQNAVQNVMRELADAKEHIDRTVLPSSHTFGGRPCLNMKEFFKLMTDKDKKQQNLDALYSLVDNDSDSIIGFIELNGLSFIDEWLDRSRKENDHWFSLCILQFLAHQNLSITYAALQTAPIAKAVKQFVNPINDRLSSSAVLSPQSVPRLTEHIRALLPDNLNVSRANDNFVQVITRPVIHKICREDRNIETIRYLQSQFANRIVNKWKKFVGEWKKSNSVTKYRVIRFADEQLKPLASSTAFNAQDAPMTITQQRDKKRREKMLTTQKWFHPQRMHMEPVYDSDQKRLIDRGRDSKEKKLQKERVSIELEEFSIGTENLKDPKSLESNKASVLKTLIEVIPLESEQTSPSPDKTNTVNVAPQPPNIQTYPAAAAHIIPPSYPHPHPHPHPPPAAVYGYPPHPYSHPPPGYHPHIPPPPYAPHPGYPPNMQPPPHPTHPMTRAPVGYHGHFAPNMNMRRINATNNGINATNATNAVNGKSVQVLNGESQVNNNKNNHRKREFAVNRPAKRQKTHDRHYDESTNDRDYRRRDHMHRKRHNKHNKYNDKRHKMRRGRNRGNSNGRERLERNNTKDGMKYEYNTYNSGIQYNYNYSEAYLQKQNDEYLFIYFMFMFLVLCYFFSGK